MKNLVKALAGAGLVAGSLALAADGVQSGCGVAKCEAKAGACQQACLTTAALAALVRAGTPVVILDARTGKYDDGRRLPGAKALSPDATAEQAAAAIGGKDKLVVTYCANLHCQASGKLAAHLRDLGYTNVVEYPDGIQGWTDAGQTVTAPAG